VTLSGIRKAVNELKGANTIWSPPTKVTGSLVGKVVRQERRNP
jgi:hypothetical protein